MTKPSVFAGTFSLTGGFAANGGSSQDVGHGFGWFLPG